MDSYSVPYSAFVIGFFELVAIAWVYGIDRHFDNIRRMMGFSIWPSCYWKFMLKYGCPTIIAAILAMVISKLSPLKYNDYTYPVYAEYIGWTITLASVVMIPLFAMLELGKVCQGSKKLKVRRRMFSENVTSNWYSQDILRPEIEFNNDSDKKDVMPVAEKVKSAKLATHEVEGQLNYGYVCTEQMKNGVGDNSTISYDIDKKARLLTYNITSKYPPST